MALWTPAEIATEAWFDADDAGTVTLSGSDLTQWADKSGRGITTANVGGNPLWGDYGGYKAVRFSGAEYMNMSLAVEGVDHIFAFVVRKDSTAGIAPQILAGANNANFQFRQLDTGANLQVVGNPVTWENTTLGVANPGYSDVLFIFNGASSGATLRTNGSFDVAGGTQTGSRQYARIGARDSGNDPYKGEIREIIVFSDASSVEKIEGYLAHKWGLEANLPAEHPYKDAAPTNDVGDIAAEGSATTPSVTATGITSQTITASGAINTPAAQASGSVGANDATATGNATTPAIQVSGAASQTVSASGAADIAPTQASGVAAQTVSASGAIITPSTQTSGVTSQTVSASGNATTPATTALGNAGAVLPETATGNATTPATGATGQASQTVSASGGAVIPLVQASGQARLTVHAAGNANTAPVEASGETTQATQASGAIVLSLPEATGAARVTVFASGGAVTSAVQVFGSVGNLSMRRFEGPNYRQGGTLQDSKRGGTLAPSIRSRRII